MPRSLLPLPSVCALSGIDAVTRSGAGMGTSGAPGLITVSWVLCDCPPAQAVRERVGGGPAGHMAVFCNAAPGCRPVWYRPRHEPTELGVCRAHLCQVRPAQQQDAPGWQDPGAAAQRRCVKPVSSNCRHGASPAWLAREYEGRSAYEWACNPRLGARSSMGGVAVPSPADKMQPVQRPGAAPWLARPWLVPCVPHV
jgi:hypothetical protein